MPTLDGPKILRLRNAKAWTQANLAERTRDVDVEGKAGVSTRVLWDAEKGKPVSPRTHLLLARALGVAPWALLPAREQWRRVAITALPVALLFIVAIGAVAGAVHVGERMNQDTAYRVPPPRPEPLFDDMRGMRKLTSDVTLRHDLLCKSLTISRSVTLDTDGHNIFCTGTFINKGEILTGYVGYGNLPASYGGSGGDAACSASSGDKGFITLGARALAPTLSADLVQRWYDNGLMHKLAGASGAGFTNGFARVGGAGAYGVYVQARRIEAGLIHAEGADSVSGGGGGGGAIVLAYGDGGLLPGTYLVGGGHGGDSRCGARGSGAQGRVFALAYGATQPIDPVADAGFVAGVWRDPKVVITSVHFLGKRGDYTLVISGDGFGSGQFQKSFFGTLPYFKVGDTTERFEAGYPGDTLKLSYRSWSDRRVVVSGLQAEPGDCIGINLWNPLTRDGAAWAGNIPRPYPGTPRIVSARISSDGEITIVGKGFGRPPTSLPFSSNDGLIYFSDVAYHSWGHGPSVLFNVGDRDDSTQLLFEYWSNTRIEIAGFTGPPLPAGMFVEAGDPVTLVVWNPHTHLATAWAGYAR